MKKTKKASVGENQATIPTRVTFDFKVLERRYHSLTPREKSIFRLVVCGKMNKEIVDVLGISLVTVKLHRGRVMKKMAVCNSAQLVQAAVALGLLGVVVETIKHHQYTSFPNLELPVSHDILCLRELTEPGFAGMHQQTGFILL